MGDNLTVVDLGTGLTAKDIASGGWHQCVILTNDSVKCWGTNTDGELGLGDSTIRGFSPGTMGDNLPTVDLGTGRTALNIYAGDDPTCVILDNNTVKCWGRCATGVCGQGSIDDIGDDAGEMGDNLAAIDLGTGRSAVQLDLGAAHVCALLDDGTVKCWGWNANGSLGQGHGDNIGDAAGEMGDNLPAVDLGTGRTAVQIATGRIHSCALLDNSSVKCWGNNTLGQLGLEDTTFRGDNAGEMGDNLPAVNLGTGRTAVAIAAGGFTTCVKLDNDDIKCWGGNSFGQLAQNSTDNIGDNVGEMGDNLAAINTGF
jgi:alpha-tubulin suppressor-like RCC1 family protein